jgi:hypothetical protein
LILDSNFKQEILKLDEKSEIIENFWGKIKNSFKNYKEKFEKYTSFYDNNEKKFS